MTTAWKKVNASAGLYIRIAQTGSAILGSLKYGDVIEVDLAAVSGWFRILRWYRGTIQQNLPNLESSWCSGAYLVPTTAPVIDPPTPPEPTPEFPNEVYLSLSPELTAEKRKYILEG